MGKIEYEMNKDTTEQAGSIGIFNGEETQVQNQQTENANGVYGKFGIPVNSQIDNNFGGVQNQAGNAEKNQNSKEKIKEDAGSIAGSMELPKAGGYMGGLFGTQNSAQSQSDYVGGYINQEQVQSGAIGYDLDEYADSLADNLPTTKTGLWSKIKSLIFPETGVEIAFNLSPKTIKVLTQFHDFLFQDISIKGFFNILKIGKNK